MGKSIKVDKDHYILLLEVELPTGEKFKLVKVFKYIENEEYRTDDWCFNVWDWNYIMYEFNLQKNKWEIVIIYSTNSDSDYYRDDKHYIGVLWENIWCDGLITDELLTEKKIELGIIETKIDDEIKEYKQLNMFGVDNE